jgi:ribosome-binding protein aMBF1 (putative translation factor)
MTISSPRKRNSKLVADLQSERDPDNSDRIRTNMLIAARIAMALQEKGWNKIKLAAELKKSPSLVTRWLSGTHNFTVDTLREIQQALGIYLLNLEMQQTKARPCAIVAQDTPMNICERVETYTAIPPAGHKRQPSPLHVQSGVQIFSVHSFVPN